MPKRHVLNHSHNFLSAEAIRNLLAKESLIRGDAVEDPKENSSSEGMTSTCTACYVYFQWKVSDSASSSVYYFMPARPDPFGDEESLRAIYAEFADEEVALANEGLAEFRQVMKEYDGE